MHVKKHSLHTVDEPTYFCLQDTASLAYQQSRYWLGLAYSNATYLYTWADGGDAGSGPPSQYPYAHFVYNFQDLKGSYPTWTCTGAWSGWTYDTWVAARQCGFSK